MTIFISFDKCDALLCDVIATELESQGHSVLRESASVTASLQMEDRARHQIRDCDVILVLLTENSVQSRRVNSELTCAHEWMKRIVPVLQRGVNISAFTQLPGDIEYITYEPEDYGRCVERIRDFASRLPPQPVQNAVSTLGAQRNDGPSFDTLGKDEIRDVFWLSSPQARRPLEDRLLASIRSIIHQYISAPSVGYLFNIGALKTDDYAVILRRETLHSLFRAIRNGKLDAMRFAGYEAGALYGVGVIKWLLAKTQETRDRPALPADSEAVVEACIEIDRKAGLGKSVTLEVLDTFPGQPGWRAVLTVEDHFLANIPFSSDVRSDDYWTNAAKCFWHGYLEGTFTTALATWYGLLMLPDWRKASDVASLAARLECIDEAGTSARNLSFRVEVRPPTRLKSYLVLQRELLLPYLQNDQPRIVAKARTVVEEFVRDLAGVSGSRSEDMVRGFSWLSHNVSNESKESVAKLQSTRNTLHKGAHESEVPNDREVKEIVSRTTASVLMGMRDIILNDEQQAALGRELSG